MALENPDLLRTPGLTLRPKPPTPAPVPALQLSWLWPHLVSFLFFWLLFRIFEKK